MIAIITFGLPGSGKTTYINSLKSSGYFNNVRVISADEIKKTLQSWDMNNPSASHQESVELAKQEVLNCIKCGTSFIFDSGSINNKYSRNLFKQIYEAGYDIELVYFDTPLEVCIERNRSRDFHVPEDDIYKKHGQMNESFLALIPYLSTISFVRDK